MKRAIEEALQSLVDLPLWGATRACDLESFQFGERRVVNNEKGGTRTVGSWALHIQCAWRIRDSKKIIVASSDRLIRADHVSQSDKSSYWDKIGENQLDQRIKSFMEDKENSLKVESVSANEVGDICLKLNLNYFLEVFTDFSAGDNEYWRLLAPKMSAPHFVVTTLGIENDV